LVIATGIEPASLATVLPSLINFSVELDHSLSALVKIWHLVIDLEASAACPAMDPSSQGSGCLDPSAQSG
jgi:hypothetical protein